MITKLGVPRLDGGAAVRAMAEAITLVRALSGGGDPGTFDGEFYHVDGLDPAAAPVPRVFTGSVGPKSLAVTGQLAVVVSCPAVVPAAPGGLRVPGRHRELQMPVFAVSRA